MRGLSGCLFLVVMLMAVPAVAQSLEKLDIAKGEQLAQALCVNCHRVADDPGATVMVDVPGFVEVANRRSMTAEKIESYVLSPHPAMPTIQFTRDELSDISAYIMSLRRADETG